MPSRPTLSKPPSSRWEQPRLRLGMAAARLHRLRLGRVAFIGVTGSCGKTTTKELVAAALGSELRGRKSPGEGNGLAVVSKTMLRTNAADAFCVLEVAASTPGSVAQTARLIRPRVAVITNVGSDHFSAFRTLEETASEKRALLDAVVEGGTAVLNADDPHVIAMAAGFRGRVITFGRSPDAFLRAEDVRSPWPERLSFNLRCEGRSLPVSTMLCGKHWASGALAALGVAAAMDVPLERAADALATVPPPPGRMSPAWRGGVTFIRDDVKAPFWGLDTAFEFLDEARAARKIAVIGTLSDFPGSASSKYRSAARRALQVADEVVLVGPNAKYVGKMASSHGHALRVFPTVEEAQAQLRADLRDGDLVLLKGSQRADMLQRIVDTVSEATLMAPRPMSHWSRSPSPSARAR